MNLLAESLAVDEMSQNAFFTFLNSLGQRSGCAQNMCRPAKGLNH